jgi:hypothetical protein
MEIQVIEKKIFEIRGHKVMLDFDLAALYEVETKRLNESVKRNIFRFPDDFMFQLTKEEWGLMWSQFATTSNNRTRKDSLPYAFTEHWVTMLASVLNSENAIKMNIEIVRAFISLRKFASQYTDIIVQLQDLKDRVGNHDAHLNKIYEALDKLLNKQDEETDWEERQRIGFNVKE